MSQVFADSFYFIGLLNPGDEYHEIVFEYSRNLSRQITTTTCVFIEVADALSDPAMRGRASNLLHRAS